MADSNTIIPRTKLLLSIVDVGEKGGAVLITATTDRQGYDFAAPSLKAGLLSLEDLIWREMYGADPPKEGA